MLNNPASRSMLFARLVSRITNPTIIAIIVLVILAFTKHATLVEGFGDIALIFLLFCLVPAIYVYIKAVRRDKSAKSLADLTTYLKYHPVDILILGFIMGLPCVLLLWAIKAPVCLISSVIALLAGALVTAGFNLFYRASFHLAGVTILIIIAAYSWGNLYLLFLIIVPLIAWSKYKIGDHTIMQLILGLIIGVTIGVMTMSLIC